MNDIARRLQIPGLPETTGPWARTVAWNGLIFISGLRGLEADTGRPAATRQRRIALIFDHLRVILDQHGSSLERVLATRVYVTNMVELRPAVNDAFVAAFGNHLPTRTIVEVTALNQEDDVEIEFVAAAKLPA